MTVKATVSEIVNACDVDVGSGSDSNSDRTANITATVIETDREGVLNGLID